MPITVLVVDDSATMRALIELNLRELGEVRVITAKNGVEALEKMASDRPALVLVDVNMPVMNGLQFVDALRNTTGDKVTPVIICTTKGEEGAVEAGLKKGANAYLTKPVN